jgi:hypothetical protein
MNRLIYHLHRMLNHMLLVSLLLVCQEHRMLNRMLLVSLLLVCQEHRMLNRMLLVSHSVGVFPVHCVQS